MRKTWIWALVLVFALAGAVFAEDNGEEAEPTWEEVTEGRLADLEAGLAKTISVSGELKVNAVSDNDFFGPFDVGSSASLGLSIGGGSGSNWSVSVGLDGANLKTGGNFSLANYRGTLNADAFDVLVANNVAIGGLGDPFGYVGSGSRKGTDRIRLSTSFGGFRTTAEFESGSSVIGLYGSTTVSDMTIGGAAHLDRAAGGTNNFSGYVSSSFGILDVTVGAGSVGGATVWGVDLEAGVTEQLTLDAKFESDDTYSVGATYVEGLLLATAGYDESGAATVSATYRGDAGNQGFADLFKKTHYFRNVAPAFRGEYNTGSDTATLQATAPLQDNFHVLGTATISSSTKIELDARYAVNDKFTISPYFVSDATTTFGSNFAYAVSGNASINANIESDDGDRSSSFGFTLKF